MDVKEIIIVPALSSTVNSSAIVSPSTGSVFIRSSLASRDTLDTRRSPPHANRRFPDKMGWLGAWQNPQQNHIGRVFVLQQLAACRHELVYQLGAPIRTGWCARTGSAGTPSVEDPFRQGVTQSGAAQHQHKSIVLDGFDKDLDSLSLIVRSSLTSSMFNSVAMRPAVGRLGYPRRPNRAKISARQQHRLPRSKSIPIAPRTPRPISNCTGS